MGRLRYFPNLSNLDKLSSIYILLCYLHIAKASEWFPNNGSSGKSSGGSVLKIAMRSTEEGKV